MSTVNPAEQIELFQRNYLRLRRHPFIKQLPKAKVSWSWKASTKITTRKVIRPADHIIIGYVTLVRGFLLNDDAWSIDSLPNLYRRVGASKFRELKLRRIRKQFHSWFKQSARINLNGHQYTHEDVFEVYTYGNVFHFTRAAELGKIREHWISYDVLMDRLCDVLQVFFYVLGAIYTCNEAVLSSHSKNKVLPLP